MENKYVKMDVLPGLLSARALSFVFDIDIKKSSPVDLFEEDYANLIGLSSVGTVTLIKIFLLDCNQAGANFSLKP
jgi:hypothetical protein